MATEAARKAIAKFNKEQTSSIQVRLNHKTDADILAHLGSLTESKMGYIKRLIRQDMKKTPGA